MWVLCNVGSTLHGLVTQLIGGAQAVTVMGQDVQQHDGLHSQNHAVPHPELDLCNLWKVATGWAGKPKKETMAPQEGHLRLLPDQLHCLVEEDRGG